MSIKEINRQLERQYREDSSLVWPRHIIGLLNRGIVVDVILDVDTVADVVFAQFKTVTDRAPLATLFAKARPTLAGLRLWASSLSPFPAAMERIYVFLALFTVVYFLEAIGGSYINSAVQNIERQFQMSSKTSGMMIAASDFGYIPCVVFTAYFGSKGNRAKWIGGGAIIVSVSYLLLASPNFLFPKGKIDLNTTSIASDLVPSESQLSENSTLRQLLDYPLIRDRMPHDLYAKLLKLQDDGSPIDSSKIANELINATAKRTATSYSVDGWLIDKALDESDKVLYGAQDQGRLKTMLSHFPQEKGQQFDTRPGEDPKKCSCTFCRLWTANEQSATDDQRVKMSKPKRQHLPVLGLLFLFDDSWESEELSLGKKSLPAYFGAISSIRVLGPICGYLIGSACNKFYFTLSPPTGLTPADPTWIGAWWIGFLFIGTITIFPSLLLFFFPSGTKDGKAVQLFDAHKHKEEKGKSVKEKIKDFRDCCKAVFSSKIYMGSVVGRICDVLAFKGYIVFLPKYLENHFGIPQYLVHRYMAFFGVFGFGLGTATGGFLTKKMKLNGRRAAMFVAVVSTLNVVIYSSKIFIGCESIVNSIGLNNRDTNYNFSRPCNSECSCEGVKLYPVCDETGYAYFSPCHAGCREAMSPEGPDSHNLQFSSCECAKGGTVSKKFCKDTCRMSTVIFFMTVLPGAFVAGLGVVPGILIFLRSVPPETRSLCLGLQGLLVSLFGTLPSPILWGFVIDATCMVWDHTCSGERGSCAIYHPQKLRVWMHVLYVIVRGISLTMDLYVWWYAKHLNIMDDPVNEDQEVDARKHSMTMTPVVTEN
ncbi:unnamed protein product [Caenorhabditis auriculariae]|uniref:Solute carrier organic anion transporter family member n=1 Tax=Caenorhabditis auriculariae TaxID=2777116 RepID=A0A8S1H0F6_9PELO|nr:unnamed protein product [Caenorhabditis auriculariae]